MAKASAGFSYLLGLKQEGRRLIFAWGDSAKIALDISNRVVDNAASVVNSA